MKEFTSDKIRNLGLIGQRGTGKTTLADALAFITGVNNRQGSVDDGSSISDFTQREIDKKTSMSTTALALPWKDVKINLLDMPGHPDYVGDVITGLQVVGNACIVIDAQDGVDAGAAANFEIAHSYNRPVMFFVNKLERENVNWESCLDSLREQFGNRVAPVNIPIGSGEEFKGIIDLLHMKEIVVDASGNRSEQEIPADHQAQAEKWREALVEQVAETDDSYLEKFFEEGTLTDEEIKDGLRKGSLSGQVYATLFGSAATRTGVTLLADFAQEYLPAPSDFPAMKLHKDGSDDEVEVAVDASGKPMVYVYKISSEGHSGDMFYYRALSGSIKAGAELINHTRGNAERLGQLYVLQGKERKEVSSLQAGDLGAAVKLKNTHIGDTLGPKDTPLTFPRPTYPDPVMDAAIRPVKKGDDEKMAEGLNRMREADPSFKVVQDAALKQTLLFGQGNTQIDILVDRLKADYGVEVQLSKPKIPYRETIKGKTELQHRYKKQSGGRGQFGDVHLRIEPLTRGEGFEFGNEVTGGVIPSKFIPSVEKGVKEAMVEGPLSGSPVVDIKATVYYGSYHAVDSSDMAFKLAALLAFREGFMNCKPTILEPVYQVTVLTPDDHTGDVMGDVSARRGKILGMEPSGKMQIVKAHIPQAELYNYTVDLRSMTQGQGRYTRDFSHYEEAPGDVQAKIKSEYAASKSED